MEAPPRSRVLSFVFVPKNSWRIAYTVWSGLHSQIAPSLLVPCGVMEVRFRALDCHRAMDNSFFVELCK